MGVAEDIRGFKAKYGPLTSKKWFIAGELVLVLLVNIFRWAEPFGMLLIGWTSLWLRGMTWRDVGLTNPKSWKRTLLFSAVFTVAVIAFSVTVS